MQTRKLGLAALLLVAYAAASEQPAAAASEQPAAAASEQPAASPEAEAASPPPSPSPPSPPPPPPPPPVAVAKSAAQLEAAKTAAAAHAAEAAGAAAKIHAAVTQHGFYTDTVKPFWDDRVAPLVRTYLGSSVCEFLDKLEIYIKDVTEMLKGVDVAELHAHVTAGTLAATSGLIAGGCLVLAPIIFGAEWLTYVLTLLASIVGLVGSTMLLEPAGLFGVRLEILVGGASKCVATLVIQLGAAYTLGSLVNGMRHVAYFAIGAVGAGYGSYLISETVVGLMAQIEVSAEFRPRCVIIRMTLALGFYSSLLLTSRLSAHRSAVPRVLRSWSPATWLSMRSPRTRSSSPAPPSPSSVASCSAVSTTP